MIFFNLSNSFDIIMNNNNYRNNICKLLSTYMRNDEAIKLENAIFENVKNANEYKILIFQSIKDIKDNNYSNINKYNIWKHDLYLDARLEEEEQNNFIIQPFEVYEGILTCSCGSNRVYSYQKQTRSADEMSTTIARCMKCNKKWINN